MPAVFAVDACRTPIGKIKGALSGVRPDHLTAGVLRALMARCDWLDPATIDDVYWGAANQAGEDNRNVARMGVLLAGLPVTVVVRVRADRVFYSPPPPRVPGAPGKPAKHGPAVRCGDPATQASPGTVQEGQARHGPVRAAAISCAAVSMLGWLLAPSGPGLAKRLARNLVSPVFSTYTAHSHG